MTKGRKLRLAFLAVVVALFFGVVAIAHAGSHLGADNRADSAATCTLCQNAATTHTTPALVSAPIVTVDAVLAPASSILAAVPVRAHRTRGPPALS